MFSKAEWEERPDLCGWYGTRYAGNLVRAANGSKFAWALPRAVYDLGEYTGGSICRWKGPRELNIDGDSLLCSWQRRNPEWCGHTSCQDGWGSPRCWDVCRWQFRCQSHLLQPNRGRKSSVRHIYSCWYIWSMLGSTSRPLSFTHARLRRHHIVLADPKPSFATTLYFSLMTSPKVIG